MNRTAARVLLAAGLLGLLPGRVAAAAELTAAEAAQARSAAVGTALTFAHLPLGLDRDGPVRMQRVDYRAPGARTLAPDGAGGWRELPGATVLQFVADRSVPDAPRIGLTLAADGSSAEGVLLGADGVLYALQGLPFGGGLRFEVRHAQQDARGRPVDFGCDNSTAPPGLLQPPELDALRIALDGHPAIDAASRSAVVAVDTDNELLLQKFADNTSNASNYLSALFTGMNVIYERDLVLTLLQGTTLLRISSTADPYIETSTSNQLDEFGDEWAANQGGVSRAFAMLLSGKSSSPNSSAGIAWVLGNVNYCSQRNLTFPGCVDGTCTAGHYSVSQVFKFAGSTAASDLLVVPHELGHNLGASHAHCSNATTGVGGQSTNTIDQCFNTESGCFTGTKVCPAPATINGVANVTGTLMSYCHLSGLPSCGSSQVFATAHVTLLAPRVANNLTLGCFSSSATPNAAPTLAAIANPAAILEDASQQTVNLSGIGMGTGDSGQVLTVTASSNNTGLIPNPTVTYTSPNATGSLSYTPVANQSGSAVITVTVTDNGGTANGGVNTTSRTFTVNVTAVNDAPVLNAIANPAAILEDAAQQTINLSGIGMGSGDSGQVLTVTASSNNTGLIPNPSVTYTSPNATGSLAYTPVAGQSGSAIITVTVSDNGGTANGGVNSSSRTFTVNVTAVNDAPVLNAIANPAAILEDAAQQTINLSGIGMGVGDSGQVLTVTASSSNTGLIPNPTITYTSPNATGSLAYTPVANQSGSAVITVTVTDNGGTANGGINTASRTFTVNVTDINDAPVLNAIANPAAILEDAAQQTINLSGIGMGTGDSGQALTVTASSSNTGLIPNPTVTYTSPNATGSLGYTPVAGQSGSAVITVTVTDNGGTANGGVNSASRTFTVNVTAVNDVPVLNAIANPAAILEDAGQQTINLSGIGMGAGDSGQVLSVTASSNNTGLIPNPTVTYTSPNATGSLSYTPVAGQSGSAIVTVTVTDDGGTANGGINTASRTFTVNVTDINNAPVLNAIANPAAILEDAGQQTINLSGIGMGAGDSGQVLSVTASSNNTGLIPNPTVTYTSPNATGSLAYTPVANQSGSAVITVTVTDNGGTANGGVNTTSRTFTVNVTAVNDAPVLNAIANPAAILEDAGQQVVNLAGIGMGVGDSGQALTVTASSNNTGLIPNPTVTYTSPNGTGSLSYTPVAGQSGSAVITVTVTDDGGTANGGVNSVSRSFTQIVGADDLFANGFE